MKTTPLRQKFIETLTIQGYSTRTIQSYVGAVSKLARHFNQSPDQLDDEQIRAFLYHLHTQGDASRSTINVTINGLRCFYRELLGRSVDELTRALPRPRKSVRRPQAYSVQEVHRLLECGVISPKYRTFFMTLYGAGLRLSEGCHLKVADIDSQRMMIRVQQGKGRKDRYTILPQSLLEQLRSYYRLYHPRDWLFVARGQPERPLKARSVQLTFKKAVGHAGLPDKGGPHVLRHSFATHLIEAGVPVHVVKRLLGHTSITTTMGYLHISQPTLEKVVNPLDQMSWAGALAF